VADDDRVDVVLALADSVLSSCVVTSRPPSLDTTVLAGIAPRANRPRLSILESRASTSGCSQQSGWGVGTVAAFIELASVSVAVSFNIPVPADLGVRRAGLHVNDSSASSAAARRLPTGSVSGQTRSRCPTERFSTRLPTPCRVWLSTGLQSAGHRDEAWLERDCPLVVALPTSPSLPVQDEVGERCDEGDYRGRSPQLSATIEVVDRHEKLLGSGRFSTDQARLHRTAHVCEELA